MAVQGIHMAWIIVKDIKSALKFYTEILGFTLQEYQADYGWAELSGPTGARLGIAQESKEQGCCGEDLGTKAGINAVVAITVDNLDTALTSYKKKGVKLIGDIQVVPGQVELADYCRSRWKQIPARRNALTPNRREAVWSARPLLSRFVFLNLDLDHDLNLEKQDQDHDQDRD